jgi:hypothetical protein
MRTLGSIPARRFAHAVRPEVVNPCPALAAVSLEGLAEPGEICVSGRVQEDAHGKLAVPSKMLGSSSSRTLRTRCGSIGCG